MCQPEERNASRDEKKALIKSLDNYVEARVSEVLKQKGIKERCGCCGKEK